MIFMVNLMVRERQTGKRISDRELNPGSSRIPKRCEGVYIIAHVSLTLSLKDYQHHRHHHQFQGLNLLVNTGLKRQAILFLVFISVDDNKTASE
jgi:hypothetical protein